MRGNCQSRARTAIIALLLWITCCLGIGCESPREVPPNSLLVEGKGVKESVLFSVEELKSLEEGIVEAEYFSINSYGTKAYTHFKGIWVWYLLSAKVSLTDDASRVSFIAEDGYTVEYMLEDVKRDDYIDEQNPHTHYKMILAWEENGYEYDERDGNPLQLVVGQREPGDVNKPYWVRNVVKISID
ncbi:MAG: hypothetical protein ACOX0E_02445 [Syntrophomonadaceae bacterium]|jgi:hypothetical protein